MDTLSDYLHEETALCPYCGIDSIIGESSGYPITEEFLAEMKAYWFGDTMDKHYANEH